MAKLLLFTLLLFTIAPAIAEEADPHSKLSLSLSLGKNEAYPGEAVPVTVTLRINDATVRNIGYPRLAAPGGKTIVFAPPVQESEAGDTAVILQRFTGQISGVKPGTRIVGPARLDCEVMKSAAGSDAFFGGQEPEPVQLTSTAATLAVLPLPASGKPEHFSGAIGAFSLSVTSLPAHIAPGEPLTVTTTIRGVGSLMGASCPSITGHDLQSFPVQATRGASQLICEQVVVPNIEMQFPSVVWSFFDPEQRRYNVLLAEVNSRVVAKPPAVVTQPLLSDRKTAHVPPNRGLITPLSLLATVAVVLGLLTVLLRKRCTTILNTGLQENSDHLKILLRNAEVAVSNGDVEMFYNIAFEVIQNMERVDIPYEIAPNEKSAIQRTDDEEQYRLTEVKHMIARCDKVRYGRILPNDTSLESDLELLKKILSFTL
jgi:hypothetical protein